VSGLALFRLTGASMALLAAGYALAQEQDTVRPGEPVPRDVAQPVAEAPLPRTYADACGSCHDNNGFGVQVLEDRLGPDRALLHQRSDLPAALIRVAVRNGIGAMPRCQRRRFPMRSLKLSSPSWCGSASKARRHEAP
jgi:mono/diheme cytochrome c family protein